MRESDLMRLCKACGAEKPIKEFWGGATKRGCCRVCANAKQREKYAAKVGGLKTPRQKPSEEQKLEMQRLYSKRWRERNPEKSRQVAKEYARRAPDVTRARAARRLEKKRDEIYAYNSAKRSKLKVATPSWSEKFFILEAYRLARLRTTVTGIKWSVDHIVPLQSSIVCGLHCHTNIRVVPAVINSSKGNRWWPDMP